MCQTDSPLPLPHSLILISHFPQIQTGDLERSEVRAGRLVVTGDWNRHILPISSHRAEGGRIGPGALRTGWEVKLSSAVIDFDSITS